MKIIVSELHRGGLRQAQKKIGEIEAAVESGEGEAAAGVAVGLGTQFDAAEVAAPAPRVLFAGIDERIGKRKRLVASAQRVDVAQPREIRKRKIGKPEIKWVLRDAVDPESPRYVLREGVEILSRDAIPVEVHARVVDDFAEAADVANINVEAAHGCRAADARERVRQIVPAVLKTEAHVEIVARSAAPPAAHQSAAKTVHQAQVHAVHVAVQRRREMKILEVDGKIRFGDELQQARSGGVNLRDHVSRKRQLRLRVEDHHRRTGIGAGKDLGIGEIAAALGKCGHGRKRVERILRARPGVVDEEKRLVAAMIYLWNIERPAEVAAKTVLRVTGLERLAGQRIRGGVESRIVNRVKQRAVRAVDVEAAAPAANDHDLSAPAT